MKKTIGCSLILGSLVLLGVQIKSQITSSYRFEKSYGQYWSLADKSSTIPAKREYIQKFSSALSEGYTKGEFSRYNAIWLQTPNNEFEMNLRALETLSQRLEEIREMKPSSFEYNTAIQQITAQEQGEAREMLHVLYGCFALSNFPIVWGWIGLLLLGLELITALFIGPVIFLISDY